MLPIWNRNPPFIDEKSQNTGPGQWTFHYEAVGEASVHTGGLPKSVMEIQLSHMIIERAKQTVNLEIL